MDTVFMFGENFEHYRKGVDLIDVSKGATTVWSLEGINRFSTGEATR